MPRHTRRMHGDDRRGEATETRGMVEQARRELDPIGNRTFVAALILIVLGLLGFAVVLYLRG